MDVRALWAQSCLVNPYVHRALGALLVITMASCGDNPPYFIAGSATLPSCAEPPAFDVDGSMWGDGGLVTIETVGCDGALPGEVFQSCPLTWAMTQTGQDIEILVDEEYTILGRLCGDTLHLEGGWWLPVQDEMMCTYEEDSAAEVGIQMGGSTLVIVDDEVMGGLVATGTLQVRGPCDAAFDMTLFRFN